MWFRKIDSKIHEQVKIKQLDLQGEFEEKT